MAEFTPFKLQIMASDHMVFDGNAEVVSLNTTEGSIGILAQHADIIMAVIPGILEYVPVSDAEGNHVDTSRQTVVVSDGLLKVENGEVMILVETAERPEDIDEARARRAAEKAKEDLKRSRSNREHAIINAELSRALSRVKASKNRHK